MRFGTLIALLVMTSSARADGYSPVIEMPAPIDVVERRIELMEALPTLTHTGSKSSIAAYRQELSRYNSIYIAGFLSEIIEICNSLNRVERKVNQEWDRGNLSRNEKLSYDEAIADERQKCSDRHAKTSIYYGLYYELVEMYKTLDQESLVVLSECNSRDICREN